MVKTLCEQVQLFLTLAVNRRTKTLALSLEQQSSSTVGRRPESRSCIRTPGIAFNTSVVRFRKEKEVKDCHWVILGPEYTAMPLR